MSRESILLRAYSSLISCVLALFIILTSSGKIFGQDEPEEIEQYKTRIKMEYIKRSDDSKLLKATITAIIDRKPTPVEFLILTFSDETESPKELGEATSDEKGVASIVLPAEYAIGRDTAKSIFTVSFEGNEQYKGSSNEISVRDAGIKTSFDIIDSVYTATVSAYEIIDGQPGNPLSDMDVYVYVQRMFSQLKVGEGWLQDGEAVIEIPQNIPGDKEKNLELIVKIPESEIYGTVENQATVNWGVEDTAIIKHHKEKRRALWKPMAPLWMVITLSILIIGVYFHYMWIIYKLFKIKRLNKMT